MASRGDWRSRGGRAGWRGGPNGDRGGRAGRAGRGGNQARDICSYFRRGMCSYGSTCRFSHDLAEVNISGSNLDENDADARQQYLGWKRLLRKDRYGDIKGPRDALRLWEGALAILGSDNREQHQLLARDVADEDLSGHEFIMTTIRAAHPDNSTTISPAESFLKVITHPSLLDCLSVDTFVGTLYTFFGGTNGDRGITFLGHICQKLTAECQSTSGARSSNILDVAKSMLKALQELLIRDRRAQFHDNLLPLLDSLAGLIPNMTDDYSGADVDTLRIRVDAMRRLVQDAAGRLTVTEELADNIGNTWPVQSSFPIDMGIPGGRHDNDYAGISQIHILPTLGEIISDRSEYLPSTNFLHPHVLVDPVQRLIDSAFRLLRHDTFGSVKDVLRDLLKQESPAHTPFLSKQDTRAHLYLQSSIQRLFINQRNELEAIVSFAIPHNLRTKSLSEQRRWWQESSRLEQGRLVCFLSSMSGEKRLLFLEVTVKSAANDENDKNKSNLVSEKSPPSITVKLATCIRDDLRHLSQFYIEKTQGVLVDFHGVLPATFVPILKNLQRMQLEGEMSFQRWILPSRHGDESEQETNIPPPAYARKPGFTFPLKSITKDGSKRLALNPRMESDAIDIPELETLTGLDRGQCLGLIAGLTREYALIQGPPGTGKSYLGVQLVRVLLSIKEQADLGPILVICYTNHALDQFLKHLDDIGIDKIIRMGGRSQAPELEGKNLRVVSRDVPKTRVEAQTLGETYSLLAKYMEGAGNTLKPLHQARKGPTWAGLQSFLRRESPLTHRQLDPEDSDGFTAVARDPLTKWLGKRPPGTPGPGKDAVISDEQISALTGRAEKNIHALTRVERWILVENWLYQLCEDKSSLLFEAIVEAESLRGTKNAVHDEVNRRTLVQADVVGITTTSLARNIELLRRVRPKVVICEEAAEVMEAHVISALMPGIEHFIQIGDHRQLRPQIQNYSLSLETASGLAWQLDRSQFERRAVGEPGLAPAPVAQLNVQRRMRPEISQLIRRVYPNLQDHESVMNLPDVAGMRHSLFWLDHRCEEDTKNDGIGVRSHSNQWEVDMATALVRHLVRQGKYNSSDIALLTPYTGQLRKLRAALSKDFEIFVGERDQEILASEEVFENDLDERSLAATQAPVQKKQLLQTIRLATVDNFQGEEAKVIIVSLVRSNPAHKVGFLRTENRINVLLSRAQHGMYLIGSAETYLHVPMWADVHSRLAGAVGPALALRCPRHPDEPILCAEPDDFTRYSPEGGCGKPCVRRLEPCGHRCQAKCHSEVMHDAFACCQPCPRIWATCDHVCPKLCGEKCCPCMVKVDGVRLPCGHVKDGIRCYQTLNLSIIKCEAPVNKTVPGCGHSIEVGCFRNVTASIFHCPEPCAKILSCGHVCRGSCGKCRKEGDNAAVTFEHPRCNKICDRPHGTCNHRCPKRCHDGDVCGNCEARCEVRCPHSACASVCSKACVPCIEKCTWFCPHKGSCTMPCAAPCDRVPCDERCGRILDCGHQCPSFCGEDCPSGLCQECGDKGDARVDLLEFKCYSEIDLDESPIVMLGCGHFFTGETLDGLVGVDEVYTRDGAGKFDGLRNVSATLAGPIPSCPDCKQPIRQLATKRYNRLINRAVMDETCKRFLVKGRSDLEVLEHRLKELESELNLTSSGWKWDTLGQRYSDGNTLERDAVTLGKKMDADHQPTKKLLDAIVLSQAGDGPDSLSRQMSSLRMSAPASDSQITLGARLVQIKAREVMLCDKLALLKSDKSLLPYFSIRKPNNLAVKLLSDCWSLIAQAKEVNLSRIVIAATLSFAKICQLEGWYHRTHLGRAASDGTQPPVEKELASLADRADTARRLLADALDLCGELQNSAELRGTVQEMIRLSKGPRYQEVTPEELASVKTAMVSGRGGIATHSGHWYNCVNGHPFAIGECGMPMEVARCPECGARIGGQDHALVEGASRAVEMERQG